MRYVTGKRERVVDFLKNSSDVSFTLEEICDAVLGGGGGRSTVYRLVSELVTDGILRRISDGRTRRFTYQYIGGEGCHHHLHLKCNACGRLIHLNDEFSHELEAKLMSVGGFAVEEGTMLFGKCRECNGGKHNEA